MMRFTLKIGLPLLIAAASSLSCVESGKPEIRGLHCLIDSDEKGVLLEREVPKLAEIGVNLLFVEVGYSRSLRDGNMLGHLCTTWGEVGPDSLHAWGPLVRTAKMAR